MINPTAKRLFLNYLSDSVHELLRSKGDTYYNLSVKLGISDSFIRQISSRSSRKSWNAYLIYRIAKVEHVKLEDIFPPLNYTHKGFIEFRNVTGNNSVAAFKKFINQINSLL